MRLMNTVVLKYYQSRYLCCLCKAGLSAGATESWSLSKGLPDVTSYSLYLAATCSNL